MVHRKFFSENNELLDIYVSELETGFHELNQLLELEDSTSKNRFLTDSLDRMLIKVQGGRGGQEFENGRHCSDAGKKPT